MRCRPYLFENLVNYLTALSVFRETSVMVSRVQISFDTLLLICKSFKQRDERLIGFFSSLRTQLILMIQCLVAFPFNKRQLIPCPSVLTTCIQLFARSAMPTDVDLLLFICCYQLLLGRHVKNVRYLSCMNQSSIVY